MLLQIIVLTYPTECLLLLKHRLLLSKNGLLHLDRRWHMAFRGWFLKLLLKLHFT